MKVEKKSILIAVVLAVAFGPIGLLYSSVILGLILTLAVIVTGMLALPFVWLASIVFTVAATIDYNRRVDKTIALLQGARE